MNNAEIRARCEAATPGQTHELKCWPEYFRAVKSGAKTFEVRKWDRPYRVGDTLRLREYDPKKLEYTGDEVMREVTYLLDMTYLPGDNTPHFAGKVVLGLADPRIAALRASLAAMTAEREALSANKRPLNEAEIDAAMQYAIDHGLVVEARVMQSVEAGRDAAQRRAEAAERDMIDAVRYRKDCQTCKYYKGGFCLENSGGRLCGVYSRWEWRGPDGREAE